MGDAIPDVGGYRLLYEATKPIHERLNAELSALLAVDTDGMGDGEYRQLYGKRAKLLGQLEGLNMAFRALVEEPVPAASSPEVPR